MISVVVSSKNPQLFNALSKNINETIGVEYELVQINNSEGQMGLCRAYNQGASQTKFPYLCFVHEDVFFQTKDWGTHVINHFLNDDRTGLIGIAGTVYKSKMAAGWGQTEDGWIEPKRMNIIQHYKQIDRPSKRIFINPLNEIRSACVAIDGVLMITKKEVWQQHKFDESLLGFHGYDLDYSLQIVQHYKIYVVYDVLIDHFSGGNFNSQWFDEAIKVHIKWKKLLPVATLPVEPGKKAIYINGWKRLRKNMALLLNENCSFSKLIKNYNLLFSLLDEKPKLFFLYRSYFVELLKLIKLFLKTKKNSQQKRYRNTVQVV